MRLGSVVRRGAVGLLIAVWPAGRRVSRTGRGPMDADGPVIHVGRLLAGRRLRRRKSVVLLRRPRRGHLAYGCVFQPDGGAKHRYPECRTEIQRTKSFGLYEPEGLAAAAALGGTLHWQIQPEIPFYTRILHFTQ
jgi:hypothetical protein